jgi:hypothetical protein
MNFFGNFFGDITGAEAAAQIKRYSMHDAARKRADNFAIWANMYAAPYARSLRPSSKSNQRAKALAAKPDSGIKAIAEVSKIADKLVDTKKAQVEVKKEIKKSLTQGDSNKALNLAQTNKKLEKKAIVIEKQLNNRVSEGVKLAQAKNASQGSRKEVVQLRHAHKQAAPHLATAWAKHDALYEQSRLRIIIKHDQADMQAVSEKSRLAHMPRGPQKDAMMERARKKDAKRRVDQELELAKVDQAEAGRLDARAKSAGLKRMN